MNDYISQNTTCSISTDCLCMQSSRELKRPLVRSVALQDVPSLVEANLEEFKAMQKQSHTDCRISGVAARKQRRVQVNDIDFQAVNNKTRFELFGVKAALTATAASRAFFAVSPKLGCLRSGRKNCAALPIHDCGAAWTLVRASKTAAIARDRKLSESSTSPPEEPPEEEGKGL